MNLLAPAALGLALVAAPIVAMYILKMRRPVREVPSTFLWEQVLRDVQANAPWQRLRPNLLLLLQLLAVAALVVALARPYVLRAAAAQGDVVAVLDGSYLMTATDVAPSRFDAARARIGTLIDGLGADNTMSIVLATRRPRVLIAQSADRGALHAALGRATPTLETPDLAAALSVATALARGGRHATLFVYAASGGPAVAPQSGVETHISTIGGTLRDLGIVAFAAQRAPDGTVTALTGVANLGHRPTAGLVQLDAAIGNPDNPTWRAQVDLRPVSIAPGGSTVLTRTQLPANTIALRARVTGHDDLAADDTAWAAVPTTGERRVLLVSPADALPFLRVALALVPGVHLDTVAPAAYVAARARCVDAVVFEGNDALPRRLPPAPVLAVGPPPNAHSPLGLTVGKPAAGAGLQEGDDPYGLLPATGVRDVAVNQATGLGVPAWASATLRTNGRPVLVVGQDGTRREAVLGLQLANSNWGVKPSFPLLVQNLLDWLAPPTGGPAGTYRPGDGVPLGTSPCAGSVSVVTPAHARVRVAPPLPAEPFTATGQPGLYTVEQQTPYGTRRALFAVNLFPLAGTATATSRAAGGVAPTRVTRAEVPVELAPLVAALALLVLMGEWWVAAHRR